MNNLSLNIFDDSICLSNKHESHQSPSDNIQPMTQIALQDWREKLLSSDSETENLVSLCNSTFRLPTTLQQVSS